MPCDSSPPRTRLILLGASNLSIGLSHALAAARNTINQPIDVFAAIGSGRSLGTWSSVLGRSIPGILHSRIWNALQVTDTPHPPPTLALLTDIGNDIVYEVPPEQILAWVTEIIHRLQSHNARIILSLPPLARINKLSPASFLLARTLLFPRRRIKFQVARERVLHVADQLQFLADKESIATVAPPLDWYALDPVHIRRAARSTAWSHMFQVWRNPQKTPESADEPVSFSIARRLRMRFLRPAHMRILGVNFESRNQRIHAFAGDSTLQLF
jgi:hypothetical protein